MTTPIIKIKVFPKPVIKGKMDVRFPGKYLPGPGIAITQASGVVTTSVDFANMERDDNTPLDGLYVGAWDATEGLFKLVLAGWLKGEQGEQGTPGPANASDYETLALATAATIAAPVMYLRTAGYDAAGDGGGALYKRVVSLLSGTIGFQSDDGAWWQLADIDVRPQMAGAKNDVSADAATGIQAAVDHVVAVTFGAVLLSGRFLLGTSISITGRCTITGDNKQFTILYPLTSIVAIGINTNEAVVLENFGIEYGTAGGGISVTGPTVNASSIFRNLHISNCTVGIDFSRAAFYLVDNCGISCTSIGIKIGNTHNVDEGDSTIRDCLITGTSTSYGIQWASSGGLKVLNNKFIEHLYGFYCALTATAGTIGGPSTTGLYFANNSVEGIHNACFSFQRAPGSIGELFAVTISGGDCGPGAIVEVPTDAAGVWLRMLTVMGVAWIGNSSGTSVMLNMDSVDGFYCVGNTPYAPGGTTYKAIIGSAAANGEVGPNPGIGTFTASSNSGTNVTLTRS